MLFRSVAAFNYLFMEPIYQINMSRQSDVVTLMIMLLLGLAISIISTKFKQQNQEQVYKSYRTGILLETSKRLQSVEGLDAIFQVTAVQLHKLLNTPVWLYTMTEQGLSQQARVYPPEQTISCMVHLTSYEFEFATAIGASHRQRSVEQGIYEQSHCVYLSAWDASGVMVVFGFHKQALPKDSFTRDLLMEIGRAHV